MSDELPSKVQQYFGSLFKVLECHDIHPMLIANADETFNDVTDDSKVKV